MPIRLLQKKEIKKLETGAKNRIQKINEFEQKTTSELNTFRDSVEAQKKQIKKDFVSFCADTDSRKESLLNEIAELQKQRREVLSDLVPREEAIANKLKLVEEKEGEIDRLLIEANRLSMENDNKLSKIESESIKNSHQRLLIEEKIEILDEKSTSYEKKVKENDERQNKLQIDLDKQLLALEKREEAVKLGELNNKSVLEEFAKQKKLHVDSMEILKIQLEDRTATLERGFAELRNKQK